jgi:hypothetical protein
MIHDCTSQQCRIIASRVKTNALLTSYDNVRKIITIAT